MHRQSSKRSGASETRSLCARTRNKYQKEGKKHPRKIPRRAINKVASSIKQFGWRQPIVVDQAGLIVVGHVWCLAVRKLGLLGTQVKCLRTRNDCPKQGKKQ